LYCRCLKFDVVQSIRNQISGHVDLYTTQIFPLWQLSRVSTLNDELQISNFAAHAQKQDRKSLQIRLEDGQGRYMSLKHGQSMLSGRSSEKNLPVSLTSLANGSLAFSSKPLISTDSTGKSLINNSLLSWWSLWWQEAWLWPHSTSKLLKTRFFTFCIFLLFVGSSIRLSVFPLPV